MRVSFTSGFAAMALSACVLSCGGGGSQGPTPVVATPTPRPSGWGTGTALTIVSGVTDTPVAGARVVVAGIAQPATDAGGQTALAGAANEGATVDIEAAGFLTRQTVVRYGTTRLSLWPDDATLPGSYTQKLVYTSATEADSASLVPLDRLPPRVRTLSLVPTEAIQADPRAMAAHRQAADYFNVAVQGRTVFSVGGTTDMSVATRIDPSEESCAGEPGTLIAFSWTSGHEITRAEIVFCSEAPSRLPTPITHELAHVFGLGHSSDRRDVMYPYYRTNDEHGFSDREVLTMGLIYLRRGGNTWPDNDRTAASNERRLRVFVN